MDKRIWWALITLMIMVVAGGVVYITNNLKTALLVAAGVGLLSLMAYFFLRFIEFVAAFFIDKAITALAEAAREANYEPYCSKNKTYLFN